MTGAESKEAAIEVQDVDFSGGQVIDVIARDGEGGPTLTVLDYSETDVESDTFVAACPAP